MDSTDPAAPRYRAFLSYSHRDAALTAKLHRRLETYRPPRALRAALGPDGRPARLRPIFRDREELASAGDLSTPIQAALDASAALVVVCSPAAANSRWVNEEIRYFRERHPARPCFAFVVDGDPGLDPRQAPDRAALPLALLLRDLDQPTGPLGEPLAADARAQGDGFAGAALKLIAGLLGVGYDQLRRREHRRAQWRWALAGSASMLLSLVFAAMAWEATRARDAARAAQARAELELASEQQTRNFLLSVFELADANEARGEQVTVREVLDKAVARIDATRFDRPAIKSRYLATLGRAYSSLGLNKRAVELLEGAAASLPPDALAADAWAQWVDSRIELADVLFDMGDYPRGLEQLDAIDAGAARPGRSLTALQQARARNIRGDILAFSERDDEALEAYEAALAALADTGLDEQTRAAEAGRSRYGLAMLSMYAGDYAEAEHGFAAVVAQLEQSLGERHPATIGALVSRGSNAYAAGDLEQARSSWRHALDLATVVFDADNPQIGTIKNNLGRLLLEDGEAAAALPLLEAALASDRRHRSAEFDDLAFSLANLAFAQRELGDTAQARRLLEEGAAVAELSGHRMLGPILDALADLDCQSGQVASGESRAARAVTANTEHYGATAWQTDQSRLTAQACRARAGEPVDAAAVQTALASIRTRWRVVGNPFRRQAERQAALLAIAADAGKGDTPR